MDHTDNADARNNADAGIPGDDRHYTDQAYRDEIRPACPALVRHLGDATARLLHHVLVDRLGPSTAAEMIGAFDTRLDDAAGARETIESAWNLYSERMSSTRPESGWEKVTFTVTEAGVDLDDEHFRTLVAQGRKLGVVLVVTTGKPDQQDDTIWHTGSVHDREALLREAHRIALAQLDPDTAAALGTNPPMILIEDQGGLLDQPAGSPGPTPSELLARLTRAARSDAIGVDPDAVRILIGDSGEVAIRWATSPWYIVNFGASGPTVTRENDTRVIADWTERCRPSPDDQVGRETVWTSATNPWGGDTAQVITNALYIATYRRDLAAPHQLWPAPTLRISLDYRAAGRATNDPIAGTLADLIEIGQAGKVRVDIFDPSDDLAPVQGRNVALVLQAVTDLRDDTNVIPVLMGHVAPNLSPHLNAVAREIVAAVHTSWPAAARERAEDILRRQPAGPVDAQTSIAELAAMISPVQGDCPNNPPCGHPGFVHDIETDGDPIPMCGDEHCTCGQPPIGYRRSLPMRVWQDGEVVPAGQAVMDRAGRLHPSDLDVNGREWANSYGPVVAIERT